MAKWLVNPKKRRRGEHRLRLHIKGQRFIFYKGRVHRVNPYYQEVGMRYGRNPAGLAQVARRPIPFLFDGLLGMVGAFLTITIPNSFFPVTGTDLMSKLLRGASRVAAGGLVYWGARRFMPGSAGAVGAGVSLASAGSVVFDFLNLNLILGAGDSIQTLNMLSGLNPFGGLTGRYVSQLQGGRVRGVLQGGKVSAYVGTNRNVRGVVGMNKGYSIYL